MAENEVVAEPKDLDEAKGQIAGLAKLLDGTQERVVVLEGHLKSSGDMVVDLRNKLTVAEDSVKEFEGQIKTLQENNDAAGKDLADAGVVIAEVKDLKESVATLTKERDEAIDKLDITEKALVEAEKLTKGASAERKKENDIKKAQNVKFAYVFNADPGYASMTLCGIQVKPKDGIWMLTEPQFKEAAGHGVEPQRATKAE